MTRKHYEAMAAVLHAEFALHPDNLGIEIALANVTRSLADTCARDNARFDRERFYRAAVPADVLTRHCFGVIGR